MEKQKEKRNIDKKRRRSSSLPKPTWSLPVDITSEIFLRLPIKCVGRVRCVSKLWSSITIEPSFIKSFETRSSTEPSLVLFFKKWGKMFVFSLPQHKSGSNESNDSCSQSVESYQKTHPKNCYFSPTESVHGLICFREKANPIIWNPTTRQMVTLRKPEQSWTSITVFLGYDPIDGKHKVVCMPSNKTCNECRVLTLGSAQESWRTIKNNLKHRPLTDCNSCGRCINGVLYYKAILYHSNVSVLMSFDVRSEKFNMIELPLGNHLWDLLMPYEGRLGCVIDKTLFVLEDATKHKWSSKHTIPPFVRDYDQSFTTTSRLSGITLAGEFIYEPFTFRSSVFLSYFDPKKNSFRTEEFKGIVDEKLWRNHGIVHTFPNHTESLISLEHLK